MNAYTKIKLLILPLTIILFVSTGCNSYTTQTTSGRDYLSKYPNPIGVEASGINEEIEEIADIEPQLNFPARIGLAKLANGRISNLTSEEAVAWTKARDELGPGFGEFVPVSGLIAESVYSQPKSRRSATGTQAILRKLRMGAARQHLDAVLVYEVFSRTKTTSLATAVSNWTLVGAYFIPSKEIETVGHANALLLDVRNGYPYGTASTSMEKKNVVAYMGHRDRSRNLEDRNQVATALKLIPNVKKMMTRLVTDLDAGQESL